MHRHRDRPRRCAPLAEAEEMLRAIRHGEIDALVVEGSGGSKVYTLHSADEPYRNLVEQMQEGAVVLTVGATSSTPTRASRRSWASRSSRSSAATSIGSWMRPTDTNFEDLLSVGSGRCGSQPDRTRRGRLRSESLAHDQPRRPAKAA